MHRLKRWWWLSCCFFLMLDNHTQICLFLIHNTNVLPSFQSWHNLLQREESLLLSFCLAHLNKFCFVRDQLTQALLPQPLCQSYFINSYWHTEKKSYCKSLWPIGHYWWAIQYLTMCTAYISAKSTQHSTALCIQDGKN